MTEDERAEHFRNVSQDMFNDWSSNRPRQTVGKIEDFVQVPFKQDGVMITSRGRMLQHFAFMQNSGWMLMIQLLDFHDNPHTVLHILPRPCEKALPLALIVTFLKYAFTRLAFPETSHLIGPTVFLKMKLFYTVFFHDYVPLSFPIQTWMDAWDMGCQLLSDKHDVRQIDCIWKTMQPGVPLQ